MGKKIVKIKINLNIEIYDGKKNKSERMIK